MRTIHWPTAAKGETLAVSDGDKNDVLPGIHVRLASGHTIGQQFVILETAGGRPVLSDDYVCSRRQFTGLKGDGVYPPPNNAIGSVWEQLKSIDKTTMNCRLL